MPGGAVGMPDAVGERWRPPVVRVECGVPAGRRSRQAFFARAAFRLPAYLGRGRPWALRRPRRTARAQTRFTIVSDHTPISSSRPPPPTSSAAPTHSCRSRSCSAASSEHRRSVRATLTPSAVRSLGFGAPARWPGPPPPRRRRRPTSRRPSSTPSSSRTTPAGRAAHAAHVAAALVGRAAAAAAALRPLRAPRRRTAPPRSETPIWSTPRRAPR